MRHAPVRQLAALRLAVGLLGLAAILAVGWYFWGSHSPAAPVLGASSSAAADPVARPPSKLPSNPPPSLPVAVARAIAPAQVRIPDIDVDQPVVPVKVTNGVLGLPPDPNVVGWWSQGAAPGSESGAVVLAAHVDAPRYGTGVMVRLQRTPIGARIEVAAADGKGLVEYVVQARKSYPKSELPYQQLFAQSGSPRLVIVTCGGYYNKSTRQYSDNIVVIAVPR